MNYGYRTHQERFESALAKADCMREFGQFEARVEAMGIALANAIELTRCELQRPRLPKVLPACVANYVRTEGECIILEADTRRRIRQLDELTHANHVARWKYGEEDAAAQLRIDIDAARKELRRTRKR